MSYLKKIRIGTTIEGMKFLEEYVAEKLKDSSYSNYLNEKIIDLEKEDVIFFGWDWINFRDELPDVSAIYEGLDEMEEKEISYRMIIVGEDYAEYGAIETVDADPFDIIPMIYTEINFLYEQ